MQLFAKWWRVFARHWALHSALLSRAVSRVDARGMQPKLAEDARGWLEPQLQRSSGSMHFALARVSACTILHKWLSRAGRTRDTTLTRLHVGASHLGELRGARPWPKRCPYKKAYEILHRLMTNRNSLLQFFGNAFPDASKLLKSSGRRSVAGVVVQWRLEESALHFGFFINFNLQILVEAIDALKLSNENFYFESQTIRLSAYPGR